MLRQSVRYASTLGKPEKFLQTIVLSNGATYTVRTTSPTRSQIRLTKDTRNHPLWNPAMLKEGVTDESEQLSKFQKRFGDLDLGDISWIESDEAVSTTMKKAVASGGYNKKAANAAKGKEEIRNNGSNSKSNISSSELYYRANKN